MPQAQEELVAFSLVSYFYLLMYLAAPQLNLPQSLPISSLPIPDWKDSLCVSKNSLLTNTYQTLSINAHWTFIGDFMFTVLYLVWVWQFIIPCS